MKVLSRVVTAAAGVAFALSAVAVYAAAPTPPPAPSAPRGVSAAAGDQQVNLTWSPPATGAGLDGYLVDIQPPDFPRTFTQSTTLLATGLTNGRAYTFTVRAHNTTGYGPGAYAIATPHVFPPGAPNNLAATTSGAGQITLSWTPPTSNGSAPSGSPAPTIDHYTVNVSPGGISQRVSASTTTYVASNLADNITYTFSVTATNSRSVTGPGATVYAPLPIGASIGLEPTAGQATAGITATGQGFLKNENITLYWDDPSHVAASVVTDANGAFIQVVKPFAGDKPAIHKLCASVPPKPCANFSLQAPPSPTPISASPSASPSTSPSASANPQASGARTGGSVGWFSVITKPPFVFLPILAILGLLGLIAYWVLSTRRRPMAPSSPASVVHRATRPDYMAPFPTTVRAPATPIAAPPSIPPQAPWQSPIPPAAQPPLPAVQPPPPAVQPPLPAVQPLPPEVQPPPPAAAPSPFDPPHTVARPTPPREVEWPAPPTPPAAPDEPPDLPQPSD